MAGTIVVDRIESDASYASTINVAGQITFSNTVNFGVTGGTAPASGFYLPSTNNLAFTTASTERMRIDSTGEVGIGTANIPSNRDTVTPKFIVNGAGVAGSMQVVRNTTVGGGGAILELTATRGTDVNSYTILQSGDGVGTIAFAGADGTQFTPAASIQAQVDGTPGTNDMPGRLIFSTTADGAGSVTERMRINSLGYITQPYQSYAQLVYTDGTGILRNNLIPWNNNRVNRNSAYNSSTKYFTAPVAGIYFVSWQNYRNTGYTAGTGDVLQILKNGTAYVSSYYTGTVVGTVECAANDTIGFYYNNDGGATYLKESYASIWLLG